MCFIDHVCSRMDIFIRLSDFSKIHARNAEVLIMRLFVILGSRVSMSLTLLRIVYKIHTFLNDLLVLLFN